MWEYLLLFHGSNAYANALKYYLSLRIGRVSQTQLVNRLFYLQGVFRSDYMFRPSFLGHHQVVVLFKETIQYVILRF